MVGIKVSNCVIISVFLATFGLLFSVIWSLLFNFKSAVGTHCGVANILPSISATIALAPQMHVWRLSVALHTALRFIGTAGYYRWHMWRDGLEPPLPWYRLLVKVAISCTVVETLALLTLAIISSLDNKAVHENSFVAFIIFSQLYMMTSCYLIQWTHRAGWIKVTAEDARLLRMKVSIWLFNLSIFLLSIYLYLRHNWYCEPYVYSGFAACEYLTVASNMAFHSLASRDFGDHTLTFLGPGDVVSRRPKQQ